MFKVSLFVVLVTLAALCVGRSDECRDPLCGCQVVRANIKTQEQVRLIEVLRLDVWSHSSLAHIGINDIMVCNEERYVLEKVGIQYEVMIGDLYATYRDHLAQNSVESADWHSSYHPFTEIVSYSQQLAQSYPALLTITPSAGKTIQGKDIAVLKVTNGKGGSKQKILLLGGQHAREWISPATMMYITEKLLTGYGHNQNVTTLLDSFDVVIIPVLNADGYTYTWTNGSNARLWRKNRRHNSDGSYGVDLNRNWGFHWCESGASKTPSSDTYCGTGPFSEPETQAIRDISHTFGPFSGAIDFHSYGQLIMRPYGWSSTPPPSNDLLTKFGEGMKNAMAAATGVQYTNQAIWQLYLSAGSSADYWVSINITYSYGFEARDTGKYGFLLPPDQIKPSGEENFAAVSYLASQVKK